MTHTPSGGAVIGLVCCALCLYTDEFFSLRIAMVDADWVSAQIQFVDVAASINYDAAWSKTQVSSSGQMQRHGKSQLQIVANSHKAVCPNKYLPALAFAGVHCTYR